MTEREVYQKIKPFLEGYTEGINWDFKETLHETPSIIRDIMAFSNSTNSDDCYIIVGVGENTLQDGSQKIQLSSEDRRRLNTDANYLYLPNKWNIHGLSADDIEKMRQFSAKLSEQMSTAMQISQPECEYVPVSLGRSRWLYVIIIKHKVGVFVSKKDIPNEHNSNKMDVKQGVLYIRIADTTIGAKTEAASAAEQIRIWKNYLEWLESHPDAAQTEGIV
jgi:hypothetical protein